MLNKGQKAERPQPDRQQTADSRQQGEMAGMRMPNKNEHIKNLTDNIGTYMDMYEEIAVQHTILIADIPELFTACRGMLAKAEPLIESIENSRNVIRNIRHFNTLASEVLPRELNDRVCNYVIDDCNERLLQEIVQTLDEIIAALSNYLTYGRIEPFLDEGYFAGVEVRMLK